MASNPPGRCCTIGVKHEGEALGEFKTIGGYETYFAYPEDKSTDRGILILPDVMGHRSINVQLIADQFAANGYLVAIPDIFNGDPIPLNRPGNFDIFEWINKGSNGSNPHTVTEIDPVVETLIKALRSDYGVKSLGSVGYCFGAKYVMRYLKPGQIDAGYVAHPSFVSEEELKGIKGPLSIAAAETDSIFPVEKRRATEDILLKLDTPYQINLYSDVQHGFAVRADLAKPKIKWAKEQAFYQAVQWFDEYVKV